MQDDLNRIEAWAKPVEDPIKLVGILIPNVTKNLGDIIKDAGEMVDCGNRGDYHCSGDKVANILVMVLGTVPPALGDVEPMQPENLTITQW